MADNDVKSDAKLEGRLVDYSAGCIILSLKPGSEQVGLVLNKRSSENQAVPKEFLKKAKYKDLFVRMHDENTAVVSFIQPDGFGSPFGKEEPEDGKDRAKTAVRETLEETGASVAECIIPSVSYTEQPNYWAVYSNTVFAASGVGFEFRKDAIKDSYVDIRHSGMWNLNRLPVPRREYRNAGRDSNGDRPRGGKFTDAKPIYIYQAALRRIIAILLQLKQEHLEALGRPGAENAEDLVRMVVSQIPYRNFFSPRMLKTLAGLGRLDIALERLKSEDGILYNGELAAAIGANMILWLPYKLEDRKSMLNQMMQALVERCDLRIQSRMGAFLIDRLERRQKQYLVALDKDEGLREEALSDPHGRQPVISDDDEEPDDGVRYLPEELREKVEMD